MSGRALALPQGLTVAGAVDELRRVFGTDRNAEGGEGLPALYYLYVVDAGGRLSGVVSMRDLVMAPAAAPLARVMRRDVLAVPADADREEVARLMRRHGHLALPV